MITLVRNKVALFFVALAFVAISSWNAEAGGTWTPLTNSPPVSVNNCMLLSDGTVLTMNGAGQCNKLTPDIHGSYINGTWTQLAGMNYSRMFFASQILTNGNVFVAGGEYGNGGAQAEMYNPINNSWSVLPLASSASGFNFSDCSSQILPNGNVMIAPVSQFGGILIYNVAGNNWQTAASAQNQDEASWVKLASDNILTIDSFTQNSEHYVPSLNQWVADNGVPVALYGYGGELGAGFLLPNGSAFYIGATSATAIYHPGDTATSAGNWTASAGIPNNLGAVDAPAAMLVNGKILCDLGPNTGYNGPCSFYEYDYTSNTFTLVNAPGGGSSYNSIPYANSMLDLPDGTVLFVGGQNSGSLYVYTPDGTPLAAGQPVISSITQNGDGSYQLTGTGLNGISQGAAYGDDEQMATNYPIVRMTSNVTGNVYYARTYNWSSTSVQTGSKSVTTQFTLPANLPFGAYSLVVTANGIASSPVTFTNLAGGYPRVAGENGTVNFSTPADLAYGANGSYFILYAQTGSITFSNTTFGGDPDFGVGKSGYAHSFVQGAGEGGSAYFSDPVEVAYGAQGKYYYIRGVSGTVTFNPTTFGGDPDFGVSKAGYYMPYTQCAVEGGTATFSTPTDVAYGANGHHYFLYNVTGTITFSNATFGGDPNPGVGKTGFYRPSTPTVGGGVYAIQSTGDSGTALQATGDTYYNGSSYTSGVYEVATTPYSNGWSYQQWTVTSIGNGQYHIINKGDGFALMATEDPYNSGHGIVGGANKIALTPSSWNLSQQVWLFNVGTGYSIANPANSENLQSSYDSYKGSSSNYQVLGAPYSWGVGANQEWSLSWISAN